MTAKIGEVHSRMSPRELASYALLSTLGHALGNTSSDGSGNTEGLLDLQRSIYTDHIRDLNTDEYVEYLEQLLIEVEQGLLRHFLNSFSTPEGFVRAITEDKCCDDQDEGLSPALDGLDLYFNEGFTRPKYTEGRSITSGLTKGYWEGTGNEGQAYMGL